MKSPKRVYSANHIAQGVQMVARLQHKVLQHNPTSAGPLSALGASSAPAEAAAAAEMMEAHCLGCKDKRQFQVEGEEKMKNGATRKYGKCTGDSCGRTISTFVKGSQDGQA